MDRNIVTTPSKSKRLQMLPRVRKVVWIVLHHAMREGQAILLTLAITILAVLNCIVAILRWS
jgi:hypothetical protein